MSSPNRTMPTLDALILLVFGLGVPLAGVAYTIVALVRGRGDDG